MRWPNWQHADISTAELFGQHNMIEHFFYKTYKKNVLSTIMDFWILSLLTLFWKEKKMTIL